MSATFAKYITIKNRQSCEMPMIYLPVVKLLFTQCSLLHNQINFGTPLYVRLSSSMNLSRYHLIISNLLCIFST